MPIITPALQISTNVSTLKQTNALLTHCAATARDLTPVAVEKDTEATGKVAQVKIPLPFDLQSLCDVSQY